MGHHCVIKYISSIAIKQSLLDELLQRTESVIVVALLCRGKKRKKISRSRCRWSKFSTSYLWDVKFTPSWKWRWNSGCHYWVSCVDATLQVLPSTLRWRSTAIAEIKVPCSQNPELSTIPRPKHVVGQNSALPASPPATNFDFSNFCIPGAWSAAFSFLPLCLMRQQWCREQLIRLYLWYD